MQTLASLIEAIPAIDRAAMDAAQQHIDGLLKPPGSLGRLETLALQLAGMPGLGGKLAVADKLILVMCADHGVFDEGVAVTPRAVTWIQACNMTRGLTGVCALARQAGVAVEVVDIGIDGDLLPGVTSLKIARGCANIAAGPAMSRQDAEKLLLDSANLARSRAAQGIRVFGTGELGIANTTPAAALVSVLTDSDPQQVVGIGANFPHQQLHHKVRVVQRAIAANRPDASDGIDVLAKVGGFDLVGMAGTILGAASCGLPVVLDGFLSYASALAACRIAPGARQYLIASHLSAEKGSLIALQHLGMTPYLNMEMRLGEGSGAALAMPLLDAACAMYNVMGTLAGSDIHLPSANH
ncbi:nicotinate-nucleotide--dimethylbenzimidazole phosphoribosyltransferase [Entomohabitans teleogrylli]|uniref:nicotinate-nucleotide--dimethylbenzimidazole phosphoribosyltransferase n=1 Tax=Entomohabitans teleogrylli TaxID=1384589 RepID=UPI00073D25E3|nr:nicotinate-nucleotide--dimethylbenzimidazole phosphoribosyltransferase [Entomohabitans teleogrylli]